MDCVVFCASHIVGCQPLHPPEKIKGHQVENKEANGNADAAHQTGEATAADVKETQASGSTSESQSASDSVKRWGRGTIRTTFSDSDSDGELDDLSREDLVKLVAEKEQYLTRSRKSLAEWKDKILRSYAEMQNVMEPTRRDAENLKKFANQAGYTLHGRIIRNFRPAKVGVTVALENNEANS